MHVARVECSAREINSTRTSHGNAGECDYEEGKVMFPTENISRFCMVPVSPSMLIVLCLLYAATFTLVVYLVVRLIVTQSKPKDNEDRYEDCQGKYPGGRYPW